MTYVLYHFQVLDPSHRKNTGLLLVCHCACFLQHNVHCSGTLWPATVAYQILMYVIIMNRSNIGRGLFIQSACDLRVSGVGGFDRNGAPCLKSTQAHDKVKCLQHEDVLG